MGDQEAKEVVESVSKNELAAKAHMKLARKSFDVEVPKQLSTIETMEAAINEIRKSGNEEQLARLPEAEHKVSELRKDAISGTLVPLKTAELLVVQGLITETALLGRERSFEINVQLYVMSRAENCGTIYLSLRRRDNPKERYFKTDDEVALLDDRTLAELARHYREAFVLTEEERKNI